MKGSSLTSIPIPGCNVTEKVVKEFNHALDCIEKILATVDALGEVPEGSSLLKFISEVKEDFTAIK